MTDPQRGLPHVPDRWSLEAVVTHIEGQHPLFDVPPPVDDQRGFRGPVAATAAQITYRQLDYWARTGLVEPTLRGAHGSGSQRLYSFRDILALSLVKRLLDTGVSLANIRTALGTLRAHGTHDLAGITLLSDGVTVYECSTDQQVIDLVRGGQGVFGIAIGQVWTDVQATLDPPAHRNPHRSGGGDLPDQHCGSSARFAGARAPRPSPGPRPGSPAHAVADERSSGNRDSHIASTRQRQQQLGPHRDQNVAVEHPHQVLDGSLVQDRPDRPSAAPQGDPDQPGRHPEPDNTEWDNSRVPSAGPRNWSR